MSAIRRLLAQRRLALLFCAAALMMKLLVPTGYMIDSDHGRLAVVLCPGSTAVAATGMADMPGGADMHEATDMHRAAGDHGGTKGGKADMPCAFSGLSAAALGAIDPIQVAALIAFVLALDTAAVMLPPPSRPAYLYPPRRGPPALP